MLRSALEYDLAQIETRLAGISDRLNWRWSDNNMAHARMLVCDIEAFGALHEFPVILIDADGDGLSIVPDNGDVAIDKFIAHAPDDLRFAVRRLREAMAEMDMLRTKLEGMSELVSNLTIERHYLEQEIEQLRKGLIL